MPHLSALLLSVLLWLAVALPAAADGRAELLARLDKAAAVYTELIQAPDRSVPQQLLANSRCIAVIPGVVKGAWIIGGRFGRGVVSCKRSKGDWSPPVLLTLTGGSVGFQIGASSTDVVLFFTNERGVRSLLDSKIKLGADISLAAGPVGRTAEAGTDLNLNAEIYSYARARGLFAGVSVEGAHLAADTGDTAHLYQSFVAPERILFERDVVDAPAGAWKLVRMLPVDSVF